MPQDRGEGRKVRSWVTEYGVGVSDSALGSTEGRKDLGAYSFSGGRLWGTRELMYSFAMTLLCIQRSHSRGGRRLASIKESVFPYEEASPPQPRRRSLAGSTPSAAVPKMDDGAQLANALTVSVQNYPGKRIMTNPLLNLLWIRCSGSFRGDNWG